MKTGVKYSVIWLFFLFSYTEAVFPCDYEYRNKTNYYFKVMMIPATWADARLRCKLEGATLASPFNLEMKNEMTAQMAYLDKGLELFTGIHATFSKGNFYSLEGLVFIAKNQLWAENEPNNFNNNEQCITLNENGELADRPCHEPRPYLCYRPHDKKIVLNACQNTDPEYYFDERTERCYKFHTVPRTFLRAHVACTAEDGFMTIISSEIESTVLKDIFAKYPQNTMLGTFEKDAAFIGFNDLLDPGHWRNLNGLTLTESSYDKFASGQPEEGLRCGAVDRAGLLSVLDCKTPAPFICEKFAINHDCTVWYNLD